MYVLTLMPLPLSLRLCDLLLSRIIYFDKHNINGQDMSKLLKCAYIVDLVFFSCLCYQKNYIALPLIQG